MGRAGGYDAGGATPGTRKQLSQLMADYADPVLTRATTGEPGRVTALPIPQPQKPWTVMVFMDTRDQTLAASWRADINAMERAGSNENVNVVVQLGHAAGDTLRIYVQPNNNLTDIRSANVIVTPTVPVNPGDPEALRAFIAWAHTNFPAEHYALVLAGTVRGGRES